MKKTRFSKSLFAKMMLFSIVAFLLLFLSGNEWLYVDSAPRMTDDYVATEEIYEEEDDYEVEADDPVLVVEPEEETEDWPERVVFLTIDDGPSRYTLDFLTVLAELDVPATFFLIGQHIEDMLPHSQELLHQILAEGHYIGLHSMTHDRAILYQGEGAAERFVTEMIENQTLVYRLTGHHTNLCRPPFGSRGNFTPDHDLALAATAINCIDWNVDPRDWFYREPEMVYQNIRAGVYRLNFPSEVMIVAHETSWTLEALPDIVAFLREHGYVFKIYMPDFEFSYHHYH